MEERGMNTWFTAPWLYAEYALVIVPRLPDVRIHAPSQVLLVSFLRLCTCERTDLNALQIPASPFTFCNVTTLEVIRPVLRTKIEYISS